MGRETAGRGVTAGHDPALDGIRGVAILAVMACHFFAVLRPAGLVQTGLFHAAGYGAHGVDLFFVLSGYLITGILLSTRLDAHYFKNFYARRALRIFPLYYASLCLLFVILPVLFSQARTELAESIPYQGWAWFYGVNFFRFFHPHHDFPYLGHFWSLSIEEHFYLVWPLLIRFVAPSNLLRTVPWMIVAIWTVTALEPLLPVNPERYLFVTTPFRVDMLLVGAAMALWKRHGRLDERMRAVTISALLAGIALTGLALLFERHGLAASDYFRGVRLVARRIVVIALFTWLAAAVPTTIVYRALTSATLTFFGKYSYGLYVIHAMIGLALFRAGVDQKLSRLTGSSLLGVTANAAIATVASVLLALMSYRFLESPFLTLKARFSSTRDRDRRGTTVTNGEQFPIPMPARPEVESPRPEASIH